ncbi:MAG: hypothetical protein ACRD8W_30840 [Nitrososphaeraceae archaeon]
MSDYNKNSLPYKNYDYYLPQRVGPGALANEQVRRCYKCKEPIAFKKRPDGTYQLLNYFDGTFHEHGRKEEEVDDRE